MILAAAADWILSNPDRVVLIEGHCDERGTNQHKGARRRRLRGGGESVMPANRSVAPAWGDVTITPL